MNNYFFQDSVSELKRENREKEEALRENERVLEENERATKENEIALKENERALKENERALALLLQEIESQEALMLAKHDGEERNLVYEIWTSNYISKF